MCIHRKLNIKDSSKVKSCFETMVSISMGVSHSKVMGHDSLHYPRGLKREKVSYQTFVGHIIQY